MPEDSYLEMARKARIRDDIHRIADSMERIANFIDYLQGTINVEYQKKLEREKKKKKVKKDG